MPTKTLFYGMEFTLLLAICPKHRKKLLFSAIFGHIQKLYLPYAHSSLKVWFTNLSFSGK